MESKTLEFDNIRQARAKYDFKLPPNMVIDSIRTHFDKSKGKYITTIYYKDKSE